MIFHDNDMNPHDYILLFWHIDDVRRVRPDLSNKQCREVLRQCEDCHEEGIGISLDIIRVIAEECFPPYVM